MIAGSRLAFVGAAQGVGDRLQGDALRIGVSLGGSREGGGRAGEAGEDKAQAHGGDGSFSAGWSKTATSHGMRRERRPCRKRTP